MNYRPGELDERITFQERVNASDGMGGTTITWQDIPTLADVWAHVRQKSGREVTEFDRVNAEKTHVFVIRKRDDVLESYRILWDGEPFDIVSAPKVKRRSMYMEIEAISGVAQ